MKKKLKDYLPTHESIAKSSKFKRLKPYMESSYLWSNDCESIARGVAAGLAGCVIPGIQFFYAALLAILFRGNLPVAMISTLVTNPLTVIPVTYFVYCLGALIIGKDKNNFVSDPFKWDFSSLHAFWLSFSGWFVQFGKAFLIGLPISSVILGVLGYFGTKCVWKISGLVLSKRRNK